MRNNGCLNALGLGLGLSIGSGLIYYFVTDADFRLVVGVTVILALGIVLGSVGLLLNNRQWTRNIGPGATNYRIDARPQAPPYYPPTWNSYPGPGGYNHSQLGAPPLPDMPPMPDYLRSDDDSIGPVV